MNSFPTCAETASLHSPDPPGDTRGLSFISARVLIQASSLRTPNSLLGPAKSQDGSCFLQLLLL